MTDTLQAKSGALSPERFESAMANVRQRTGAQAATLRFFLSLFFALLSTALWQIWNLGDWGAYVPILGAYTVFSAIVFKLRFSPLTVRLAWLPAILDVGLVYTLQSHTLPLSPFPAGVAGFSLGLFALLVALGGLTLYSYVVFVVAICSTITQVLLMAQAGISSGPMIAAGLVLFAVAATVYGVIRRTRLVALQIAKTETALYDERRQNAELEAAKQTIERMLDEATNRNTQLVRLQQDKDSLVQLIVHDLRNPLSVIIGTAQLLPRFLQNTAVDKEVLSYIEGIDKTSERMANMIAQILDTTKLEQGVIQVTKTSWVVETFLKKIAHDAGTLHQCKDMRMEVLAPAELILHADELLLTRVVENLVSNSIRFSPSDGTILLAAVSNPAEIQISVHNNGPAIELGNRKSLFEKYVRGPRYQGPGWGLGLYFCRMAVEAHGGTITIEDVPGWSVSFIVRLPIAETKI